MVLAGEAMTPGELTRNRRAAIGDFVVSIIVTGAIGGFLLMLAMGAIH